MTGLSADPLVIDGTHGEGGGQILRSALSLAAITGRAIRIENIRAKRRHPGLAAQHLTSVRAVAALCNADLAGDELGSQRLAFAPRGPVQPGDYRFDVSEAREGGSAGAAPLVLQSVLPPLAFAAAPSTVSVIGGTHVPWSPSADYLTDVWQVMLRRLGVDVDIRMLRSGWYPAGGGEIAASVNAGGGTPAPGGLAPLHLAERGELQAISIRAIAANLPAHIPQRMSDRARALLEPLHVPLAVRPQRLTALTPGAATFVAARYEHVTCGFTAMGRQGKPSEEVAEEAVSLFAEHHASGAALDRHLADQILLPLALAAGTSSFTCPARTSHLETNAWLIERFGLARFAFEALDDGTLRVEVDPEAGPENPLSR